MSALEARRMLQMKRTDWMPGPHPESTLRPQGAGLSPRVDTQLPLLPMPFSVTCAAFQDHRTSRCNAQVKTATCVFSKRRRSVDELKPTEVWHDFSAKASPELSSL